VKGSVYVLVNSSMPDLVKIGKTTKDPQSRARELHQTGTPTPFVVAYSVLVNDCDALEAKMHDLLDQFRQSDNREFFKVSSTRAIDLLREAASSYVAEESEEADSDSEERLYKSIYPPRSNLYIARLRPFVEINPGGNNPIRIKRSMLDNDTALDQLKQKNILADDGPSHADEVTVYVSSDISGTSLYRFGFTEIEEDDFRRSLYTYVQLSNLLATVAEIRYRIETPEFDWKPVALEFSDYVISFTEQLIIAPDAMAKAFFEKMWSTGKWDFVEKKKKERLAQEAAAQDSLRRQLSRKL